MPIDIPKTYFGQSTIILHTSTVCYLGLLFVCPQIPILNIIFASLYTIQTILKILLQKRIYWSSYYSWNFVLLDIISGPAALGLGIYYLLHKNQDINIVSVFILIKIMTCRMCIKLLKQLAYLFNSSIKYLRLSLSLALCFTSMSYYLFQTTSEYFVDASQSFFSMYQLSTFDGWNQQPVKDVREKLSNYWLLYFLVYFLFMVVSYIVTNLGFFVTYYSDPELQHDFSFKDQNSITVENLAIYMGMTQRNKKYITRYFLLFAFLEWKFLRVKEYRIVYFSVIMFVSLFLSVRRVIRYRTNLTLSSWCVIARGVVCPIVTGALFATHNNIAYAMILYLSTCVIDIFRHNELLLAVFKSHYQDIIQYLLILSTFCYVFAVAIFQNSQLSEIEQMKERTSRLIDAYLFNIEIVGFDGWGDITHQVLRQHPMWVWYIIAIVFICGFTIVNVFLGELLNEMTPYITDYLKEYKLMTTLIPYKTLDGLVAECAKKAPRKTDGV